MAMRGASLEDELLASSQKTVAVESSAIDTNRSTAVLKPAAGSSQGESGGRLVVSSFKSTAIELGVVVPSSPKSSTSGDPSKAKTDKIRIEGPVSPVPELVPEATSVMRKPVLSKSRMKSISIIPGD